MTTAEADNMTPQQARASLWMSGVLVWLLHENQLIIDRAIGALPPDVKEAVLLCCRRFGKSYYGCVKGLSNGLTGQRRLTRIIGPDIKQTKMIVEYNMAKIIMELPKLGLRGLVEHVKSENMYRIKKPGRPEAAIFLGGFDSQEDSLRGGEADEILIEESGSSDPDQYDYQMRSILKPQILKTRGRMIHLTTLPKLPDHPFITETMPQAMLDDAYYSYTIYEDPLATPEIIADAIKDCGGIASGTFMREYMNIVVRDKGLVIIPDYDDAIDSEDFVVPSVINLEVFTDWGGVQDKTVCLLMGHSFLAARDLVIDELYFDHNTPTFIIVRAIRESWGVEAASDYLVSLVGHNNMVKRHYADVPGQLQIDLQTAPHSYPVTVPPKGDWDAAVNNMANRFTQRKIKIHTRCKFLRQTCRSGTLNKQRTDFARTTSLGHMDACAALMYGIRALDRSSPYSPQSSEHDWMHFKTPTEQVIELVPGRTLTPGRGYKKFGGR